ncbi:hypothetical protein XA68_17851 [Ophiocordyceps unilateralis]|uniref:Integrase catalytic domain-containing protein n=1 Tax=Ophiocordyceps unilateralis TaxID=268505 RepID=A0A2A9P3B7_OPHUN|nr:hypothetical protein XA68_17851 [Ophiocordyceps unilateralis]
MDAEACASRFLSCWFRFHGWPRSITSDRGTNWTSRFWAQLCKLLQIDQLLSTSHHPQTDGGPERMNQELQAYLRAFIARNQRDWDTWLPAAQFAINSRPNATIGMSPYFATHGYHPRSPLLVENKNTTTTSANTPEERASQFIDKIRQVTDLSAAAAASSVET